MIRLTHTITPDLAKKLERESKRSDLKKSDIVRRALELYFEKVKK